MSYIHVTTFHGVELTS